MDKEMWDRISEAGKYQKLAFQALLPERVNNHLEVIEKEIKAMVLEIAMDLGGMGMNAGADSGTSSERKVKNINIS